jgi:hypothetical protein
MKFPGLHPDAVDANPHTKYDLVANVVHVGKATAGEYKIQVSRLLLKIIEVLVL